MTKRTYSRNLHDRDTPVNWESSPYTYDMSDGEYSDTGEDTEIDDESCPFTRNVDPASPHNRRVTFLQLDGKKEHQPPVIISSPPKGHYANFNWTRFDSDAKIDLNRDSYFTQQPFDLFDKRMLFGRLLRIMSVKKSLQVKTKDNKEQAANAVQLADKITSVPLSTFMHASLRIAMLTTIILNIGVAIADIVVGKYSKLHFKLPVLAMSIVELCIMVVMWLWFRQSNGQLKRQQYVENITQEVMMHILTILSIWSFSTEKTYRTPDNAFGWVQIALLFIDVLGIFAAQVMRMVIVYKLIRDIITMLNPVGGNKVYSPIANAVLFRMLMVIIANFFVYISLALMLLAQVHSDNYFSENFDITWRSGSLILALTLMPWLNLLSFALVNYYWLLEILVSMNIKLATDVEFQNHMKSKYGEMVTDIINAAMLKANTSKKTLADINATAYMKKLLWVLQQPLSAIVFFAWQAIILLTSVAFDADYCFINCKYIYWILMVTFVICTCLINVHALLATISFNIMISLLFSVVIPFYPVCVPLLFWVKQTTHEDKHKLD